MDAASTYRLGVFMTCKTLDFPWKDATFACYMEDARAQDAFVLWFVWKGKGSTVLLKDPRSRAVAVGFMLDALR